MDLKSSEILRKDDRNHVALITKEPERIPCKFCGRGFKATSHLAMHMQAKHSYKTATPQLKSAKSLGTLSLECIQIMTGSILSKKQSKMTDEVINSQDRQTLIHTVRYSCKKKRRKAYNNSIIIPCTYCNRCFKSYAFLALHVQKQHIPKSLLILSLECIATIMNSVSFKKQTVAEVADPQDEQILINTARSVKRVNVGTKSRRRKHKCKHCMLYFTYLQDLNNHITEKHNKPQQKMPQPLIIKQEPNRIKEEPCDYYIQKTPDSNESPYKSIPRSITTKSTNPKKRSYTKTLINNHCVFEEQYEGIKKRKSQELSLKINNVFRDVLEAERKEFKIRCNFCMHYFCDFMDLYNHQDHVHGGCRECRICWMALSSKKLLFQHLSVIHKIRGRVRQPIKQEPHVNEKPYIQPKEIKKEKFDLSNIKIEIPTDLNIKSEPTEPKTKIKEEPLFHYF